MLFMPLDVQRLLDSDLFITATGDEFKAAVALWCKSWNQVPAASLPDNERILADYSRAGSRWAKVRSVALSGWVKASDGRLYHAVVAEKALEAWESRNQHREQANVERDRKRRERDDRKQLFADLRAAGQVPAWDTSTSELRRLLADLSRVTGVTGHADVPVTSCDTSRLRQGQGQLRDRDRDSSLMLLPQHQSATPPAAAAASPDEGITDQPREVQIVKARTFGDFQALHGRVYVPGHERDAWNSTFTEYGWAPMEDAYRTLDAETPPGRRILLSRLLDWLAKNYKKTGGTV